MIFNYSTDDKGRLAGITKAREAYNAENKLAPIGSDQAYFQLIADRWAMSFALQHGTDIDAIEAQMADLAKRKKALA